MRHRVFFPHRSDRSRSLSQSIAVETRSSAAGLDSPLRHHGGLQGPALLSAVAQAQRSVLKRLRGSRGPGEKPWKTMGKTRLNVENLWENHGKPWEF